VRTFLPGVYGKGNWFVAFVFAVTAVIRFVR